MARARRLPVPSPERARRTHAERTAETRARILAAVVESIDEVGFSGTTAAEIARRAGVTWGAVQHHFGGKDGILVAVVEQSFDHFVEQLGDLPAEDCSLEERAALFIDRAWGHFGSAVYRSTFEILLNYASRPGAGETPQWQGQMFEAWDQVWQRIFHDAPLPRRRRFALQHFTISCLSGLASTLMLEGSENRLLRAELDLLKGALVRELVDGRG